MILRIPGDQEILCMINIIKTSIIQLFYLSYYQSVILLQIRHAQKNHCLKKLLSLLENTLPNYLQLTNQIQQNFYHQNINSAYIYIVITNLNMQSKSSKIKQLIWNRLRQLFDGFRAGNKQIPTSDIDWLIIDILGGNQRSQRDYLIRNLWRLDSDCSGSISLNEFGNFLLRHLCGQLSLQKQYKKGSGKYASEFKLTGEDILRLINNSLIFLKVELGSDVVDQLLKTYDNDGDRLITYLQYLQLIENQFLAEQIEAIPLAKGDKAKLRKSKIRRFIWQNLRRVYNIQVQDRQLKATPQILKILVHSIFEGLSQNQSNIIVMSLLFKIGGKDLVFQQFASPFLLLLGELGLCRVSINRDPANRILHAEDAAILGNSFVFCDFSNFSWDVLIANYNKMDKNGDGTITYDEYIEWIRDFVAVVELYGQAYYTPQDDEDADSSNPLKTPPKPTVVKKPVISFIFNDHSFANKVRETTKKLLEVYDADKNGEFNKIEIEAALIGLLKQNPDQLKYVTQNVFRYDRNNDGSVSYDELTNFCTEHHFGEMAIQRLHRKKHYSEGNKRRMNCSEFGITLTDVLGYIGLSAPAELISEWFSVIDVKKEGWISYEVYFMFLRQYFGSDSISAQAQNISSQQSLKESHQFLQALENLNHFERFSRIIIDQLKITFSLFDYNQNKKFEENEIRDILAQVFSLNSSQLSYMMMKYFSFESSVGGETKFEQLISLILVVYFTEIVFKRNEGKDNSINWRNMKIKFDKFSSIFSSSCYFIRLKPSPQDLTIIFNDLDNDHDGQITFREYSGFIQQYLGSNIDLSVHNFKPLANNSSIQQENLLIDSIWSELKKYFDLYDKQNKGFLTEAEFKTFIVEVLQEISEKQLSYIFWNLFRVDSNYNNQIDFQQFAPFILGYAGQIALQRFHRDQTFGKKTLSSLQFYKVIYNAFSFLSSIPKQKATLLSIFNRIKDTETTCNYGAFLSWIHKSLASKHQK